MICEPLDYTCKVIEVNGNDFVEKIHRVVVHTFTVGDVEDPDLYAAEPLYKWEQSEEGQWVMANAVETPIWQRANDIAMYGYRYKIIARLRDKDLTWLKLKYS